MIDMYFDILGKVVKEVKFFDTYHAKYITRALHTKSDNLYTHPKRRVRQHGQWMYRQLFLPYNINENHWILLVIDTDRRTVAQYDSLGSTGEISSVFATMDSSGHLTGDLIAYLTKVENLPNGAQIAPWHFRKAITPQQQNSTDCGYSVMEYAKLLAYGYDPCDVYPSSMTMEQRIETFAEVRKRCVLELYMERVILI